MNDTVDRFVQSMQESQSQNPEMMDRMMAAAQPGAVFGEPITVEGQTVITATEVIAGGAMGFGGGAGVGMTPTEDEMEEGAEQKRGTGVGGGSGSVGGSMGRPVAAIVLNQDGVRVEPIVDVTKVGLAFFTTLGAILITLFKIRRDVLRG
jgi:uncharacterized spore protein YtfJ